MDDFSEFEELRKNIILSFENISSVQPSIGLSNPNNIVSSQDNSQPTINSDNILNSNKILVEEGKFESDQFDELLEIIKYNPNIKVVSMNTLDINAEDFCCLLDKNWLNDTVVNFYVNLINISTNDNIHCMNSFFYQQLYLGFDKVEKWYKKRF